MTLELTPVLSRTWDQDRSWTLEVYERHDGYAGLKAALKKSPDQVTQLVKDSELRGRGGAGFPTGMKWGFIPQGGDKPVYLVVNADESEPGTCKDVPLMMANPHELVEGVVIASYAIRAAHAFIYVRGEVGSLGADCIEKDLRDEHVAELRALLESAGIDDVHPEDFRRYGSARKLYNFSIDNASAY